MRVTKNSLTNHNPLSISSECALFHVLHAYRRTNKLYHVFSPPDFNMSELTAMFRNSILNEVLSKFGNKLLRERRKAVLLFFPSMFVFQFFHSLSNAVTFYTHRNQQWWAWMIGLWSLAHKHTLHTHVERKSYNFFGKIIHVIAKSAEQTTQTSATNRIVPRNTKPNMYFICSVLCCVYCNVCLWTFMLLVKYIGILYVLRKKAFASFGRTENYGSVAFFDLILDKILDHFQIYVLIT